MKNKRRKRPPVIDPTENVMSLVAASNLRQDDLRVMSVTYQENIGNVRTEHQRQLDSLRESYQSKLSTAEANRIDASALAESRRVDAVIASMKADVALASEKSSATAAALATSVASAAVSTVAQINEVRNSHDNRLAVLEKNQYSQGGAKTQQAEGVTGNRWVIQVVVTIGLFVLAFLLARAWPLH